MPLRAARPFSSRAKTWRGRWPLAEVGREQEAARVGFGNVAAGGEPGSHGGASLVRQGDHPLLGAFAADHEEALVARRHHERKRHQLRHPQAGGIERLDQRVEAQRGKPAADGRRRIGGFQGGPVEQATRLGRAQGLWQRSAAARRVQRARRVVGAQALGIEELEELPQHRKLAGLGGSGKAARRDAVEIAAERVGRGVGEAWTGMLGGVLEVVPVG